MERIRSIFAGQSAKRFFALALIALMLYLFKSMMNMILLTFIFTFMMYQLQKNLVMFINRFIKVNKKMVISVMYGTVVGVLALVLYTYVPVIVRELNSLVQQLLEIYKTPQTNIVIKYLVESTQNLKIEENMDQNMDLLIKSAAGIGTWGFNFFIALLLSFFFLLEKGKIVAFTMKFKDSKLGPFFDEILYFGRTFTTSFGKVIETQIIIAAINSVLSTMILYLMGFPQVLGLGIMIFFLGLIPVAGVMISLVPLCMIAVTIGGMVTVAYVLLMIIFLHAIEAYVLNPKIMSEKVNLPVFYTFIVLIVSEHLMGVWGLIIGVPIFIFILDLLDVKAEKGGH